MTSSVPPPKQRISTCSRVTGMVVSIREDEVGEADIRRLEDPPREMDGDNPFVLREQLDLSGHR